MKNIFLTSFQKFVKTESLAGNLLFGATILALIWANSPWAEIYENIWQTKFGISLGNFELHKPLILWINDGLMAIFFFLIGLELKRELLVGEINTLKKASFPFIAALGGVIVPIIIYIILNENLDTAQGWGIPMATDIAFALAILSLLSNRVPLSLKIFLTAFAIIDDIAAVSVIAIFYSSNINWLFILYALLLIIVLGLFYHKKTYVSQVGIVIAIIVWYLFLKSGIHPTIAGVLLAFTIPLKEKLNINNLSNQLKNITDKIRKRPKNAEEVELTTDEIGSIENLDDLSMTVRSPLQHLENKLHHIVAYFILPLFALANAGVSIHSNDQMDTGLMITIALSLVLGKFIGVSLFSYIGVKLNLTELPSGIQFKQILGIGFIAGIGFTMAIFIANLAFYGNQSAINAAKFGIIIGSMVAGLMGYLVLRFTSKD
jgi:NhaA family Na+:H+ antiporter